MGENLFDNLETAGAGSDGRRQWSARAPFSPAADHDLMLVPLVPEWRGSAAAHEGLARIEAEPWVASVDDDGKRLRLRLDDGWVESVGGGLEAGEGEAGFAELAAGQRYAVYFWGANTTKALHIGHLRNLALGNAIGASLRQAGGRVEHRSLICDVGRSMGEAMAGVVSSGREQQVGSDGEEKSDHFVGTCYASYVTAGRNGDGEEEGAEDSVARESALYNDQADELMMRVLSGDQPALELWSKTRAWVISGQRKTLSRLGVPFDKVIFESDFLPELRELTNRGLRDGVLSRRHGDDMVMYETRREELEQMPLVRADGLPTQHMRALAYWAAAPELDDVVSLQVCGTEWVAHVNCRRQLIDALGVQNGNGNGSLKGGGPPTHDVFHGMVARERQAITSSKEGALLIDDLIDWLEEEIAADPGWDAIRRAHPAGEQIPAQVALGYFLLQPTSKRVEFEPWKLLRGGKGSLGWDLARAQAHRGGAARLAGERPAEDPDYRFAVVQSENHRRHLRGAVESFDAVPLARYLDHFARWYEERERAPQVERVAQTVLAQGSRGLGLEDPR
jgi:arginyl-tRNA synthetase